jgi:hypothetical protein
VICVGVGSWKWVAAPLLSCGRRRYLGYTPTGTAHNLSIFLSNALVWSMILEESLRYVGVRLDDATANGGANIRRWTSVSEDRRVNTSRWGGMVIYGVQ